VIRVNREIGGDQGMQNFLEGGGVDILRLSYFYPDHPDHSEKYRENRGFAVQGRTEMFRVFRVNQTGLMNRDARGDGHGKE
jgi:hypothetical protein